MSRIEIKILLSVNFFLQRLTSFQLLAHAGISKRCKQSRSRSLFEYFKKLKKLTKVQTNNYNH